MLWVSANLIWDWIKLVKLSKPKWNIEKELDQSIGKYWLHFRTKVKKVWFDASIFPFRKLFPQREKVCKTEEISQQDFIDQLIQEVGADADEMVVIEEDDAASVIDVTEMSSRYDD